MNQHALPLVSIIVPTFNRVALLKRLIESLESQTYQNTEIVIINNGSTDGTREYLDQTYAQNSKYVIAHFDKNSGSPMACYNEGILRASGEYLGIIYDDDTLLPDAIEFLITKARENSTGWVTANCIDSRTREFTFYGVNGDAVIAFDDILKEKYTGEAWSLFKKELIKDFKFDEKMYGGESSVWLQMYRKSGALYFHRAVRVYYTQHGGNITGIKEIINNIDKILYTELEYIRLFHDDFERNGILEKKYFRIALILLLCRKRIDSLITMKKYIGLKTVHWATFHAILLLMPVPIIIQGIYLRSKLRGIG